MYGKNLTLCRSSIVCRSIFKTEISICFDRVSTWAS
ncbi:hypothetical protein OIU77_006957, partial [Salix suchowensis]